MVLMACGAPSASRSEIVVSAASSLSDAFTEMAEAFEASNPDVAITLNVGGSSSLREQILEGAAVDVFASADSRNIEDVSGELVGPARVFARNVLQIGVPSGNPANVVGLEDFERSDLLLGVCANSVPCGDLAERVLAAAGIEAVVDTYEPNVRALLGKIEAGELDAGLVYATDVESSAAVDGLSVNVAHVSDYLIAMLDESSEALAFIELVLSDAGRQILERHGFVLP